MDNLTDLDNWQYLASFKSLKIAKAFTRFLRKQLVWKFRTTKYGTVQYKLTVPQTDKYFILLYRRYAIPFEFGFKAGKKTKD